MRIRSLVGLGLLFVPVMILGRDPSLTLDDRVRAQGAIERVYHEHRGSSRSFETVYPPFVLEAKVHRYLQQSAALEQLWNRPVTAEALRRNTERIARETSTPDRVRELFAALNEDPVLIQECLVRPVLVDRWLRNRFDLDRSRNAELQETFDEWWARLSSELDEVPAGALEGLSTRPFRIENEESAPSGGGPGPVWTDPIKAGLNLSGHAAVWNGSEMLIWGGTDGTGVPYYSGPGLRYDPVLELFTPMSTVDAPSPRTRSAAVWTGTEMIVWGGWNGSEYTSSGARYDPATDTWTPMTATFPPGGRTDHTAVWTGTEMIIWGGWNGGYLADGASYDPATDTWMSLGLNGPVARSHHTAVWTGSEMIIWGGRNGSSSNDYLADGARYHPGMGSWTPVSSSGLEPRGYHTAVWTGFEMIVWGGRRSMAYPYDDGARYDPATDLWSPVTLDGGPSERYEHSAVWTGTEMIIWGGEDWPNHPAAQVYHYSPGYLPGGEFWISPAYPDPPPGRGSHSAFWTPTGMIVWGGNPLSPIGGRYLAGWGWDLFSTGTSTPQLARPYPTVWTGSELLAWGLSTGWRYDPALMSFSEINPSSGLPSGTGRTAVWTGDEMIVWGGGGGPGCDPLVSGARYNPVSDDWSPVATAGAPEGRWLHEAVWTGNQMIVWGGRTTNCEDLFDEFIATDGGLYDPSVDIWSAVPDFGLFRRQGTATVWTGDEMIVWGGQWSATEFDDGARYDPETNGWTPMSTVGAPQMTGPGIAAVWTGEEMVLWTRSGVGGRYDPLLDAWNPISDLGAPDSTCNTAVWTGTEMILWGEDNADDDVSTGASFRPSSDEWIPLSTEDSPHADCLPWPYGYLPIHNSEWIGDSMITEGLAGHPAATIARLVTNSDVDEDGALDVQDCAPLDASAWADPGPARDLSFPDPSLLTWEPPLEPGGSITYSLLRSPQADDLGTPDCVVTGTTALQAALPSEDPAPGAVDFYVVRVENACSSNAGHASNGEARITGACP